MRRAGAGVVQVIPTPAAPAPPTPAGLLIAHFGALRNSSTGALPATEQNLAFSTTIAGGFGITRSAGNFTLTNSGIYQINLVNQVQQLIAATNTKIYCKVNGALVATHPYAEAILNGAVNDYHPVVLAFNAPFVAGDVLSFNILVSAANGAGLLNIAAAGAAPAIPATLLTIAGWSV